MLRRADAIGASWCVVMGDSEVERGVVQLKDLGAHSQEELPWSEAPASIHQRLKQGRSEGSP